MKLEKTAQKWASSFILPTMYYSSDEIDEWDARRGGGARGTYVKEEMCIKSFGGETWGKETTRRIKRRWEDNIKMYIKEIVWDSVKWTNLAQNWDSWLNTVKNLRVPYNVGKFLTN
jgi:hypothetical protein